MAYATIDLTDPASLIAPSFASIDGPEDQRYYSHSETCSEQCFKDIIGNSSALQKVLEQVAIVAPTDATVLLHGETGTGKELIARAVHDLSSRRNRHFVRINCAAIPSGLLEAMQGFTKFTLHIAPTFLVLWLILLGGRCIAQEVDVPTGRGGSSVVAPTGWAELIAPVQQRIDLKFYGFYIGEVKAPSAQFDATFRATKFLSITPSYLYYAVPPDGLNELANHSGGFTRTYEEHQFRIDGTVMFSVHKFEISERNMYVRRFLPTYMYGGKSLPEKEINRYRNKIAVAYPLAVKGRIWKPFASYEAFYDQGSGWTKNRAWTGVTVPIEKHVSFQPSYMWENTNGIKDVRYLMFGLIFRMPSR